MERFLHMAGMVIMVVSIAIGIVIALSIPYALDGILYALPLYALFLGGLVGLFLFGKKLASEHDGKQDVKSFKQTVGEGKNISVQRQEPAFQEEHKSVSLEKKESDEQKDDPGLFTAKLLKTGESKVELIKNIRTLKNCSLAEAKRIAEEGGEIASTHDKFTALQWYYHFAGTDSVVQITNLHTYGIWKVNTIERIGKMEAEAQYILLSRKGIYTEVEKMDCSGNESLDARTYKVSDKRLLLNAVKDMVGFDYEQIEAWIRDDNLIIRNIDAKTKEALDIVLSVLSRYTPAAPSQQQPQTTPEPVKTNEQAPFSVTALHAGNKKIKMIKAIRHLTGKGLVEANEIAEQLGYIGQAKDKSDALYWYYQFSQSDYVVNISGVEAYGHYNVEIRNADGYSFKTAMQNAGKLYAEVKSYSLGMNGYVARVVKNEAQGTKNKSLKRLKMMIGEDLLGFVLCDMFGLTQEEFNEIMKQDDPVLHHLTDKDVDMLNETASILSAVTKRRNAEQQEHHLSLEAIKKENIKKAWQNITEAEGAYLIGAGDTKKTMPWLDFAGEMYLYLKPVRLEDIRIHMYPSTKEKLTGINLEKDNLIPFLQRCAEDGLTKVYVVSPENRTSIDTAQFLKHADSIIEEKGRSLRRTMYESTFYKQRYNSLDEQTRYNEAGDLLYSAWMNSCKNVNWYFNHGIVFTYTDLPQKQDGVTVYTQSAWNRVQEWMNKDPDLEGKLTAEGDHDTIVIPQPAGYHTLLNPEKEHYVPVFTTIKHARGIQQTILSKEENLCIVAVTFEDLKTMGDKIKGIVIDLESFGYRINRTEFNEVQEVLNEKVGISIWDKVRTTDKAPQFKRYDLSFMQEQEGRQGTSGVGSKSVWHDIIGKKWRLTTQLEEKRIWFLSQFVKEDGSFDKYCLDYEMASDAHYEFTSEKDVRGLFYQEGDEELYLDEIFSRYLKEHTGEELLKEIQKYITATYHFD